MVRPAFGRLPPSQQDAILGAALDEFAAHGFHDASLNRVIGLKWLAGLFYPDQLSNDLRETTRSFYRLFYHVDPSDAELDTLIAWSKGQAPSAAPPRR